MLTHNLLAQKCLDINMDMPLCYIEFEKQNAKKYHLTVLNS